MANKKVKIVFILVFILTSVVLISLEFFNQLKLETPKVFNPEQQNKTIKTEADTSKVQDEDIQLPVDFQE